MVIQLSWVMHRPAAPAHLTSLFLSVGWSWGHSDSSPSSSETEISPSLLLMFETDDNVRPLCCVNLSCWELREMRQCRETSHRSSRNFVSMVTILQSIL